MDIQLSLTNVLVKAATMSVTCLEQFISSIISSNVDIIKAFCRASADEPMF